MPTVLAMHMPDQMLDLPTAGATLVIAALALAAAMWRARRTLPLDRLPLMGVMGAMVFAAQMVNFPVLPGVSGHLVGTVLLAVLLGPAAAIVTMSAILLIQCLLFQDGGLLAIGCNIINMAVVPALLGGGLYRLLAGRGMPSAPRQYAAAWVACAAAVTAGAALLAIETAVSAQLLVPFGKFLAVIVGIHLLIGLAEGAITFAVLAYLRKAWPQALEAGAMTAALSGDNEAWRQKTAAMPPRKAMLASVLVTALLLAGVGSLLASGAADGLEASLQARFYGREPVKAPPPSVADAAGLHHKLSPLPDYAPANAHAAGDTHTWPSVSGWTSLAGIIGTLATLSLLYLITRLLGRRRHTTCTTRT